MFPTTNFTFSFATFGLFFLPFRSAISYRSWKVIISRSRSHVRVAQKIPAITRRLAKTSARTLVTFFSLAHDSDKDRHARLQAWGRMQKEQSRATKSKVDRRTRSKGTKATSFARSRLKSFFVSQRRRKEKKNPGKSRKKRKNLFSTSNSSGSW